MTEERVRVEDLRAGDFIWRDGGEDDPHCGYLMIAHIWPHHTEPDITVLLLDCGCFFIAGDEAEALRLVDEER